MSSTPIETVYDRKRGCGWRKPGGLYLISGTQGRDCGRLPLPLTVCPTCHCGIKPTRGWTWVNSAPLLEAQPCPMMVRPGGSAFEPTDCATCPASKPMGRVGLLWIGEKFYKRPEDFLREAHRQGISRRISTVPKEFKVGETWVWMAHRLGIENPDGTHTPAVFRMFRPERIEYVCKGTETPEEIDRLRERGITPVQIERIGESGSLLAEGVYHA
jgi:hypothetical protein